MNLQQLEYIVAVDTHRHFAKAAKSCFVTQATLSMMIRKMEEEVKIVIFDRSKQPVVPTETGKLFIEQARVVLKESSILKNLSSDLENNISGQLRIGIIPTLAPYLLPLFLQKFMEAYPQVKLKISEQNTDQILENLLLDKLDVGLMATPLLNNGYKSDPLFYERFFVYTSAKENALKKKYILPEDIDIDRLWLIKEGHCLRSQILNLCELQRAEAKKHNLEYEAGSIESLLQIVEMNAGITIVPELAVIHFSESKKQQLREFKPPVPVREVSLVTYRHFVKSRLLNVLKEEIINSVQDYLPKNRKEKVVIDI